jgi:hypothetical protein
MFYQVCCDVTRAWVFCLVVCNNSADKNWHENKLNSWYVMPWNQILTSSLGDRTTSIFSIEEWAMWARSMASAFVYLPTLWPRRWEIWSYESSVNYQTTCWPRLQPPEYVSELYLILPAALDPGVYSASNRSEYQKHKNNNVSGE